MATVKGKAGLRRTHNRRVKQVQRFTDQEIQTLEILVTHIQAALDTYRHSGTKRIIRSLRADLRVGFGTILRTVHYALQERILHARGVRGVSVATKTGRIRSDRGPNRAASPSTERGRVSENARPGLPDDFSVTPVYADPKVSGAGERLYQYDARRVVRGGKCSSDIGEAPAVCERCDI